jgi:tetratricopeptide (TPR) repeat protein
MIIQKFARPLAHTATCLPFVVAFSIAAGTPASLAQEAPASNKPIAQTFDARGFQSALMAEFEASQGRWDQAFQSYFELALRHPSDEHFDRAISMALKGRSAQNALLASRTWIKANPDSLDAYDRTVMILLAIDKMDELKEPLTELLKRTPIEQRAQAIDRLSNALRRSNQKTQARQIAQEVLEPHLSHPATSVAARRALAWLELRDNRNEQALAMARQLVEQGELHSETGMLLVSLTDRKVSGAEALLKAVLAKSDMPHVDLAYIQWMVRQQQYAPALARLQSLTQNHPELDTAWLIKGGLEYETQQLEAARVSLERYLGLAKDSGEAARSVSQARLMLAQIAAQEKRLDQADAWLAQIDDRSMHWDVQFQRAKIKESLQGLDAALAWLDQLPALNKDDQKRKLTLQSQLLKAHNDFRQAADRLRKALALQADDPELMYDLAMTIEKLGEFDEYERLLRRVIQLKPDSAHAYNALGYALADRNVRLSEAKELILKAVQLSPEDAYILDSLAWVEFRMGNAQVALDLLRKAFAKQADPEIAAHLGEVLWSMGQSDQARTIWADSLKLNPNNVVLKTTMDRLTRQ